MSDLLVLTTHAIQYQAPLFQELDQNAGVDLHVAFMERPQPDRPMWDQDFGRHISWNIPLTDGYRWSTLPSGSLAKRMSSFARLHRRVGSPPLLMFSWGTPLHWSVWTWAILSQIPVLLVAETNRCSYQAGRRPFWRHLWLRGLLQHTAAILYIGTRNKGFYRWMGVDNTRLFPCPYAVDNGRFARAQEEFLREREQRLTALELKPGLPTLLFSGKLIPKKRPDILLRAIADADLGGRVNVLFVGDGHLRHELAALARNLKLAQVAFLGFLNQAEMPMAYALGDCLCLLSDTPTETWGLVVNEAMACGRPVIVSDACGCVPDLVEGKGTGWIVPPGQLHDTAGVIRTAISRFESWPEMGRRGREVVSAHCFANMSKGILAALARANADN